MKPVGDALTQEDGSLSKPQSCMERVGLRRYESLRPLPTPNPQSRRGSSQYHPPERRGLRRKMDRGHFNPPIAWHSTRRLRSA